MMHTRLDERDSDVGAVEVPSPFRSAFARARVEARGAGDPPVAAVAAARERRVRFEVRIEKRRGRRADEARWGKLGLDGWELVSVVGKRAFFRRRHRDG